MMDTDTNISATLCGKAKNVTFPSWVVWSKRLADPPNSLAVLAINIADTSQTIGVTYDELIHARDRVVASTRGRLASEKKTENRSATSPKAAVLIGTDVWTGKVTQRVSQGGVWKEELTVAHESRFTIFSPVGEVL